MKKLFVLLLRVMILLIFFVFCSEFLTLLIFDESFGPTDLTSIEKGYLGGALCTCMLFIAANWFHKLDPNQNDIQSPHEKMHKNAYVDNAEKRVSHYTPRQDKKEK